jgi:hypothetical protein
MRMPMVLIRRRNPFRILEAGGGEEVAREAENGGAQWSFARSTGVPECGNEKRIRVRLP